MNEWIPGLPKMIGNYEFAVKGIDYPIPAFFGNITDRLGQRAVIDAHTDHFNIDRCCDGCTLEDAFNIADVTHYREASKMPE